MVGGGGVGHGAEGAIADQGPGRGPDCGRGEIGGLLQLVGNSGLALESQSEGVVGLGGVGHRGHDQGDDGHTDGFRDAGGIVGIFREFNGWVESEREELLE